MPEDLHDFFQQLIHDLRSHLGAILFSAASIPPEGGLVDGRLIRKSKQVILEEAQFIVDLINQADRIVTLQSGNYEKQQVAIDLVEYTRQILAELKVSEEREIQFVSEMDKLMICTDPLRVREALIALVDNVIQFSQADTPIEVFIRQEADEAHLTISDQYSGIPEDQQAQIFEPFNRIQTSSLSLKNGTGLGPFLARQIIESLLDGSITYLSHPKTGSKFEIFLPVGSVNKDVSELAFYGQSD